MVLESDRATAVAFLSGDATGGRVVPCEPSLFGKHVHDVAGLVDDLVGLAFDGCYSLATGAPVPACAVQGATICSGKDARFLLATSEEVYSWGTGPFGELGLGLCKTKVDDPTLLKHKASFAQLACGDYHAAAVDGVGNAYCWGQNFDRQLGLFTKDSGDLAALKPNGMVEDMSFVPVLLPFSIKAPIAKVACGAMFTLAVSRTGTLWSWGAGECGQLGTGRCTRKEVPSIVPFTAASSSSSLSFDGGSGDNEAGVAMVDVACGAAHALALAADGAVYAWGMNKRGQLGVGDTATRLAPTALPGPALAQVFAHGNSSAGIGAGGELYTWGSGARHRLMQGEGDEAHRHAPTCVSALDGMVVQRFAFSAAGAAALVVTRLYEVSPAKGPQKTFSEMRVRGCGFWDSDAIIVRFSKRPTGKEDALGITLPPPRSCAGQYVVPGVIACKPPRLAEAGLYDVSVSLDGEVFARDVLAVDIYPDVSVTALAPKVLDVLQGADQAYGAAPTQVVVTAKGLKQPPADGWVDVRLLLTALPDAPMAMKKSALVAHNPSRAVGRPVEVLARGRVVDAATARRMGGAGAPGSPLHASNGLSAASVTTASTALSGKSQPDTARSAADANLCYIAVDVDEALRTAGAAAGPDGGLITLRAQVTLNGADFSAVSTADNNTVTVCHAFRALSLAPSSCLCPADPAAPMSDVKVAGRSFFVSSEVPTSMFVQAVVTARVTVQVPVRAEDEDEDEDPADDCEMAAVEEEARVVASVKCGSQREMTFVPPSMAALLASLASAKRRGARVPQLSYLRAAVRFVLMVSADGAALVLPSSPLKGLGAGGSTATDNKSLPSREGRDREPSGVLPSQSQSLSQVLGASQSQSQSMSMHQSTASAAGGAGAGAALGSMSRAPSTGRKTSSMRAPKPPLLIDLGDASEPPLALELYVPQPVRATPVVVRRGGGTVVTVVGTFPGGFRFRPTEARVVLAPRGAGDGWAGAEASLLPADLQILPPLPAEEVAAVAADGDCGEGEGVGEEKSGDAGTGAGDAATDDAAAATAEGDREADAAADGAEVEYKVQFALPDIGTALVPPAQADALDGADAAEGAAAAAAGPLHTLSLSLLLDGLTPVSEPFSAQLWLYDALSITAVANTPKGGFVGAAAVQLAVAGLPVDSSGAAPATCLVRIRGEDKSCLVVAGAVQYAANEVAFTLPEPDRLATVAAVVVKKAKFYFVDVSLDDGASYDNSETALLNVK